MTHLDPQGRVVVGLEHHEAVSGLDDVPTDVGEIRMTTAEVEQGLNDIAEAGNLDAGDLGAAIRVVVVVEVGGSAGRQEAAALQDAAVGVDGAGETAFGGVVHRYRGGAAEAVECD